MANLSSTSVALLDCGHPASEHESITNGYGTDSKTGETRCYECCAAIERQSMIETGRAILYLTMDGQHATITDWPGHLRFETWRVQRGHHNIAGVRYDVWFNGPDGSEWHGTQYGNDTQILHCKRNKAAR